MEASGPVIIGHPPSGAVFVTEADGAGIRGFCFFYHGPSPSTAILSRTSGPLPALARFGSRQGATLILECGGKVGRTEPFSSRSGGRGGRELVREGAAAPLPCLCRPLGHPYTAHRPRSSLCGCGTPLSARTLCSLPRSLTRTSPRRPHLQRDGQSRGFPCACGPPRYTL